MITINITHDQLLAIVADACNASLTSVTLSFKPGADSPHSATATTDIKGAQRFERAVARGEKI